MRNRRLLFRPLIFMAIVFAAFSCSNAFDENAGDRITPDQNYKSVNDATGSLNGVLITLQEIVPNMILIDGLRSDQLEPTEKADPNLVAIYENNFSAGNPYLNSSDLYKTIINANEVLLHLGEILVNDPKYDSLTYNQHKGALIVLRSWCYFNLVRMYNQVVWIPDNMPQLPAQEIILDRETLLDTLTRQVRAAIPDSKKYTELRISRFINSKALLGEIYLERDSFDRAAEYLKLACESYTNQSTVLKVDKTYQQQTWYSMFIDPENSTSECIAMIPYSSYESQPNPLDICFLPDDKYLARPTSILIDSFMTQSGKEQPWDVYRGIGYSYDTAGGQPYVKKYALNLSDIYGADITTSRAGDIHLLLAEALNRSSDPLGPTLALTLLNAGFRNYAKPPASYGSKWVMNQGIRGRAYLNNKLVPKLLTDQAAIKNMVEDFIVDERALELAFEGKRWTDLMRVARRRGEAYLADKVAAKYSDPVLATAVREKLMDQANWYLPMQK